ncbi:histidine phosphatase family protein [Apilactobacillus sp. TMW 2.2459]|uniref:histidine phosphatase family protein n=1 Tax=Apilactobacillus xinyiensis TaxID=2841032 RepID=UPI00200DAF32|nr:histidine phosphatase family protein [Apilactobacillus xinyiensis]MCL0312191.1 histidine phosphatase family protein [Apilactobacillus xinyiensis]
MKIFDLYVVRHGQTYYNIYRKLQGWSNSPLTHQGQKDAENIAAKLSQIKFDAAYSSDMTRAEYTAQVILKHNQVSNIDQAISSPLLRGVFYGYYEGTNIDQANHIISATNGAKDYRELVDKYGQAKIKDFFHEADPFHQAENNDEYWQRWHAGFEAMQNDANVHDGSKVLLVSHGPAILSLIDRYGQGKYDVEKRPENGSLTKLHFDSDGQVTVLGYNIK